MKGGHGEPNFRATYIFTCSIEVGARSDVEGNDWRDTEMYVLSLGVTELLT